MTDLLAVDVKGAPCGAISYWRLSGTLQYDDLLQTWTHAGLAPEDLPEPPSEQAALRRALAQYEGPHTEVVTLPRGQGFAIVDRTFADSDADDHRPEPVHTTRFKVWLDDSRGLQVSTRDVELRRTLIRAHQAAQLELTGSDIGSWLVTRIHALGAIRLRDTGGVYFVPQTHRAVWTQIGEVLAQVSSSRIYEIPALQSDQAVDAILTALREQAIAELTRIEGLLEKGELGARALNTLAAETDARLALLTQYEQLLQVSQNELRASIEEVRARVVEAALAID